ncbi:MAG: 3-hydroxyacyl-CoA dehydrogenase NAD-binding domain-containing protein [Bacteroidota bacterium]
MNINTICVCGAGTMGSGIAQVAALSGYITIQFDVNKDMLAKSKTGIEKNLQWLLDKEKITTEQQEQCMERLRFTSEIKDCVADLIIEAIIEKKEAKTELFNRLSEINSSDSIFATNTSSIAVAEIASEIPNPRRVLGMHFFNPAPVMKLVEVIKTGYTDQQVLASVVQLAGTMGKTAVICNDAPGFIVNRVARHYYLEAMKLVEQGLATIETVDTVMESTGFKMGPFKLMDLIGMDINYRVSHIVWDALGKPERLTPSPIQKQKLDAGELGRKTGKGFYTYENK